MDINYVITKLAQANIEQPKADNTVNKIKPGEKFTPNDMSKAKPMPNTTPTQKPKEKLL